MIIRIQVFHLIFEEIKILYVWIVGQVLENEVMLLASKFGDCISIQFSKRNTVKIKKIQKLFDVKNTFSPFLFLLTIMLILDMWIFLLAGVMEVCGCFPSMNNNEMSPFKSIERRMVSFVHKAANLLLFLLFYADSMHRS